MLFISYDAVSTDVDSMKGISTAIVNGKNMELLGNDTVASIVSRLGMDRERVAVELNGEICRRCDHASQEVVKGDVLEIVSFVGGG